MISVDGQELSKRDRVQHAHLGVGTVTKLTEDTFSVAYDSLAYGWGNEVSSAIIAPADNRGIPRR